MTSFATSLATVFAGLGWEPEIRGALTVAVASAVLMGSIWLILVTNTGVRLGSLIALAGFFGWMFLMGVFWWIYGIGWTGSSPTWEVKEFVADPAGLVYEAEGTQDGVTGPVGDLPDTNCDLGAQVFPTLIGAAYAGPSTGCTPRAASLLMAYPEDGREAVLQELLNPQLEENKITAINADGITDRDAVFAELLVRSESELRAGVEAQNSTVSEDSPLWKDAAAIDERVAFLIERRDRRIDDLTLSALAALAPNVMDWADSANYLPFNGWNLLSTAQSGEAVATADAALKENVVFGAEDAQFIVMDSFQQGGKPKRTGDGMLERVWHKITSTARITHPTNYAVVQAQFANQVEATAGELPPIPEAAPAAATVSVVMERNLGNLRLIPAMLALVSLLLFLATCLVLHLRDLTLRERLAGAAA